VQRLHNSNSALLSFKIDPNVRGLTTMNFSQYVGLVVGQHQVNYSSSYTEDGTLSLLLDYGEVIEGETAALTLAYDPKLVGLPPNSLSFKLVSYNEPLKHCQPSPLEPATLYLSYTAATLLLLQLLSSLLLHKMIGL
jgi:hypothetical protein